MDEIGQLQKETYINKIYDAIYIKMLAVRYSIRDITKRITNKDKRDINYYSELLTISSKIKKLKYNDNVLFNNRELKAITDIISELVEQQYRKELISFINFIRKDIQK